MTPVTVQQSRTIGVSVDDAYRETLPIDLTVLFAHRYGPFPPITQVRDQGGRWGNAGQTRTVIMTGGGTVREELRSAEEPDSFSYRLTDATGAMAPLVEHIDGYWRFDAIDATSTLVTWQWAMYPRSALMRPVVELLGAFWNGFAKRALAELDKQIAHPV